MLCNDLWLSGDDDNFVSSCSPAFLLELLDRSHHLAVQSLRVNLDSWKNLMKYKKKSGPWM